MHHDLLDNRGSAAPINGVQCAPLEARAYEFNGYSAYDFYAMRLE
jgi:hypothetical protein